MKKWICWWVACFFGAQTMFAQSENPWELLQKAEKTAALVGQIRIFDESPLGAAYDSAMRAYLTAATIAGRRHLKRYRHEYENLLGQKATLSAIGQFCKQRCDSLQRLRKRIGQTRQTIYRISETQQHLEHLWQSWLNQYPNRADFLFLEPHLQDSLLASLQPDVKELKALVHIYDSLAQPLHAPRFIFYPSSNYSFKNYQASNFSDSLVQLPDIETWAEALRREAKVWVPALRAGALIADRSLDSLLAAPALKNHDTDFEQQIIKDLYIADAQSLPAALLNCKLCMLEVKQLKIQAAVSPDSLYRRLLHCDSLMAEVHLDEVQHEKYQFFIRERYTSSVNLLRTLDKLRFAAQEQISYTGKQLAKNTEMLVATGLLRTRQGNVSYGYLLSENARRKTYVAYSDNRSRIHWLRTLDTYGKHALVSPATDTTGHLLLTLDFLDEQGVCTDNRFLHFDKNGRLLYSQTYRAAGVSRAVLTHPKSAFVFWTTQGKTIQAEADTLRWRLLNRTGEIMAENAVALQGKLLTVLPYEDGYYMVISFLKCLLPDNHAYVSLAERKPNVLLLRLDKYGQLQAAEPVLSAVGLTAADMQVRRGRLVVKGKNDQGKTWEKIW
jgi:hypothetical protein